MATEAQKKKFRSVQALARAGSPGEKETAIKTVSEMMAKYPGIEMEVAEDAILERQQKAAAEAAAAEAAKPKKPRVAKTAPDLVATVAHAERVVRESIRPVAETLASAKAAFDRMSAVVNDAEVGTDTASQIETGVVVVHDDDDQPTGELCIQLFFNNEMLDAMLNLTEPQAEAFRLRYLQTADEALGELIEVLFTPDEGDDEDE